MIVISKAVGRTSDVYVVEHNGKQRIFQWGLDVPEEQRLAEMEAIMIQA